MNKIIGTILVIYIAIFAGCEKSTSELCGGNDPANDLLWLKQEITRLSTLTNCNSISRSTYKEQTVFIFSNCAPNVNSIPFLYDCNGNKLNLTPGDYQDLKFSGQIELIWKSN
jgi:hypothetical protein